MKNSITLALVGLLAAFTAAIPLNKRDLKYVTETSLVAKTDWVLQTVWVYPDGSPVTSGTSAPTASASNAYPTADNGQYNPVHNPIGRPLSSYVVPVPTISSEASPSQATGAPWTGSMVTETIYSTTTIHRSTVTITPTITASAQASSSAFVAPTPPSTYVAPAPISSASPAPVSSAAPVASAESVTPSSGSTSSGMAAAGTTYTGDITYYGTGLGSCGITSGYNDHIVAISHTIMDAYNTGNPNNNPLCGKTVDIKYNGQSFPATVVDRCVGCAEGDLDLSEGFFSTVTNGDTGAGRIPGVSWSWVN